MLERISIDPSVCHGQARIKDTRIPVHQIVAMLANGSTFESLLKAFPNINTEDIDACIFWTDFDTALKAHLPAW